MSLRESNLRIALLSELKRMVEERLKVERSKHLARLLKARDETGTKSFDVMLPGEDKALGTISLSSPSDSWDVDETALLKWAMEFLPTAVKETVVPPREELRYYELYPASVKALLERAEWVETEDGGYAVDPKTGEVIDGLTFKPAGKPTRFQVRLSASGKERLFAAWASGRLNEITEGALPQIGES